MKKMHVFYIHTHDSGRYWSPYGYAVPTPHIQRLAEDSLTFRHCYCCGPTCSPSRSALLTGMYPHENGMLGLAHRGFQLNDYSQHLVHHLKENGCKTILCGIQHVAPDASMIGYDTILGSQEFSMGSTEASMEEWDYNNTKALCTYLETEKEDCPVFISLGFFNTHREFPSAKGKVAQEYTAVPPVLYDCEQNRKDMADYHASVKVVDECLGMLLKTLHATGLYDSSIILMTTDHGIAFPNMKCNLYDTGIGVACLLHYPQNPSRGEATDSLISQIDILPTLCELVGIPIPCHAWGVSLVPLLEKRVKTVRSEVFSEVNYHAAYEPMRCVRTDRYKLIHFYDDHDFIVLANIDESPSKAFLMDHGLRDRRRCKTYLFDLYHDPMERENVAADAGYQEILLDMESRLLAWMVETNDPLLVHKHRIPKPPKALVNKLTCENPRLDDFEE